jgi:hypothetical protein
LAQDWPLHNTEVVSFRYEHPVKGEKGEEFYFKMLEAGPKLEVNALSSKHNDEIVSTEIEYNILIYLTKRFNYSISEELNEKSFDNLDSWVKKSIFPKFEKEIIKKLLREAKPESGEEKKNQNEHQ